MVAQNEPQRISPKKMAANRRNARKSTGPRTADGKARSSQNAITHGIFCQAAVLNGESSTEFALLRNDYLDTLKPQNILELGIVDRIVLAQWKLNRAQEAEMQQHTFLADRLNKQAKKSVTKMQSKYEFQTAAELEKMCDKSDLGDQVILERFQGLLAASELNETPASTTLALSFNATPNHPHAGIVRLSLYEQRLEGSIHRNLRQLKILRGNTDPRTWCELPDSPYLQQIKPPLEDEDLDVLQAVREISKLQNEPTEEEADASDESESICEAAACGVANSDASSTHREPPEEEKPKSEIRDKSQ